MACDGVAVIEVTELAKVNVYFSSAVHREAYPIRFDFRDRSELAVSDPFRSKRSANLEAVAFCEGALCLVVNTHTGKPRRVVSELAAIKKANGNSVCLVVGFYDSRVVACLHVVDFAGGVVADYVVEGAVGIGESALGSGHIWTRNIDGCLLIVTAYNSLAL